MDGKLVVDQHQRRGAHRIFRRSALNIEIRRALSAQRHRRLPPRFEVFAGDPRGAEPLLAGAADADRVLERLLLPGDEIEGAFAGLYNDRAGLGFTGVWNLFRDGTRWRSHKNDSDGAEEKVKIAKQHRDALLVDRGRYGIEIA